MFAAALGLGSTSFCLVQATRLVRLSVYKSVQTAETAAVTIAATATATWRQENGTEAAAAAVARQKAETNSNRNSFLIQ